MEESKPKFSILEHTTSIYAILTFFGYSYIDNYYNLWGIRIYSFLDGSEILLSFLNSLNSLLISLGAIILGILLTFIIPPSKTDINAIDKDTFFNRKIPPIFILIFILLVVVFSIFMMIKTFSIYTLFVLIVFLLIAFFVFVNKRSERIMKFYNLSINKQGHQITLVIVFLFAFSYTGAIYQYRKVFDKYTVTSFNFNYESSIYKSNDTLLYIGATSKYIFIRNTKDSTNLIFDKSSIKNLSLTEKLNTNK